MPKRKESRKARRARAPRPEEFRTCEGPPRGAQPRPLAGRDTGGGCRAKLAGLINGEGINLVWKSGRKRLACNTQFPEPLDPDRNQKILGWGL